MRALHAQWWPRIETSEKFAQNRAAISAYHATLRPGDITLVGLIAEGGQGLATGNNARFLGYLEGTAQAKHLLEKRAEWTMRWLADAEIAVRFRALLEKAGGDLDKAMNDSAAWEAVVEPLRAEFPAARLGFSKMDLYRIVPRAVVAGSDDFEFAWKERKKELWGRWRSRGELAGFWKKEPAARVPDAEFCETCIALRAWVPVMNEQLRKANMEPMPKDVLGLRSAECYRDPKDAPRIATIYSGLRGRGQWVPYSKGDSEGNRWASDQPLFIAWTKPNVEWLFGQSGRPEKGSPVVRNASLYLLPGVSWSDTGNHVALKARELPVSVNDVKSMRLTPIVPELSSSAFLALLNSDVVSFWEKKFVNNTCMYQVNDLRQIPLVIPAPSQAKRLERLAELAMSAKRHAFASEPPDNALVAECRRLADQLSAHAPDYLRPPAQAVTFQKPDDCLAVLERAVNWEAEKLYGVESIGPFDDF